MPAAPHQLLPLLPCASLLPDPRSNFQEATSWHRESREILRPPDFPSTRTARGEHAGALYDHTLGINVTSGLSTQWEFNRLSMSFFATGSFHTAYWAHFHVPTLRISAGQCLSFAVEGFSCWVLANGLEISEFAKLGVFFQRYVAHHVF